MPHRPLRPVVAALALALALAALGCSVRDRITGPDVGAVPVDPGTFELQADGLSFDELVGDAISALLPSALAGPRCHLVFVSGGAPQTTLRIWIGSELRPRLRTYLWGVDPVPFDRFTATLEIPDGETGVTEYAAIGGSLRITNNSAAEIAGEFVIDAEVPAQPGATAVTLQGSFRALPDSAAGACRDPDS